MARNKVKVETPATEIQGMILKRARRQAKAEKELLLFSRKVTRYWKRIAPVGDPTGARYVENFGGPLPKHWSQTDDEAGAYKAGIRNRKYGLIRGYPARIIEATDYKSHWIEYGTGGDTPTPEFAPRQRTATRFGAMRGATETWDSVDGPRKDRRAGKGRREGITRIDVDPDSIGDGKPARKPRGFRKPGETAAMRQSESGAA
jgi:hypothetical protein